MAKKKTFKKIKIEKEAKQLLREKKVTPVATEKTVKTVKPKVQRTEDVHKKIIDLVKQTGKAADSQTEIRFTPGNAIEKEMIAKENPQPQPLPGQQQQEQPKNEPPKQENQEQPKQTPPVDTTPNDTIAHILNGQVAIISGIMKLDPKDCMLTEDEIKAFSPLQPNGGIHVQSWWMYFLAVIPSIAAKIIIKKLEAKRQAENMDVTKVIEYLRQNGYNIQPPNPFEQMVSTLKANGYNVEKQEFTNAQDVTGMKVVI